MLASLCLFSCALAAAQPAGAPDWLLVTHVNRGQELVYSGRYMEESIGQGVRFNRIYDLESRVLVLDTPSDGSNVAFFTVLRQQLRTDTAAAAPTSVRLELAKVGSHGNIALQSGGSVAVPLEGPPTAEFGAFLESPKKRIGLDSSWERSESARPIQRWNVAGSESVRGTPCLKLTAVQQSDDWDHARADRAAWRRLDTVWISPRLGFACKVERVIERREPAHRDPTQRSVLAYSLESSLTYPEQLLEDCRREIGRAHSFAEAAEPYVAEPGKQGASKSLEAILTRVDLHLDRQPATPYREAMLQVKHRIEAALRGEAAPPLQVVAATEPAPTVATMGEAVPDFTVPDLVSGGSARLKLFLGKPVVLVFYTPASPTAEELLTFAQSLHAHSRGRVSVVGLAVSDERDAVLKQRNDLRLGFAMLSGNGLRVTYAVDATPKIVVLDSTGVLRANFSGWGRETPTEVSQELKTWLGPDAPRK
jgi:peroxiredoxin